MRGQILTVWIKCPADVDAENIKIEVERAIRAFNNKAPGAAVRLDSFDIEDDEEFHGFDTEGAAE